MNTNRIGRATEQTFQTLGLKHPTYVFETVHAAYRRRCFETHPDQGDDAADFCAVREAWALLDTPEKWGRRGRSAPRGRQTSTD